MNLGLDWSLSKELAIMCVSERRGCVVIFVMAVWAHSEYFLCSHGSTGAGCQ